MSKPNVLVVGSGGVGSVTALSLVTRDRSTVTLVVRSDYDLVASRGIEFRSCSYGHIRNWKPHHLARSVADAARDFGPFDYVVLTTKNIPDGPSPCEHIVRPAITPHTTTLILVQNGIGIEKVMLKSFPNTIVLSGIQMVGSSYQNGVVDHIAPDNLKIGEFVPSTGGRTAHVISQFIDIYQNDNSLNSVAIDPNPKLSRWTKLVYNSVFNTITAIAGTDSNRAQIAAGSDSLIRPAMREVIAIARSDGAHITPDVVDRFCHLGDGLFYTPSMAVDRQKGQLMEIEVILGNPLAIARANGVETPILSTLYGLLRMCQLKTMEDRGYVTINKADFAGNSDEYMAIFAQKYRQ